MINLLIGFAVGVVTLIGIVVGVYKYFQITIFRRVENEFHEMVRSIKTKTTEKGWVLYSEGYLSNEPSDLPDADLERIYPTPYERDKADYASRQAALKELVVNGEIHRMAAEGDVEGLSLTWSEFWWVGTITNIQDSDGDTPLHMAAGQGQFAAVRWLVNHYADVNIENKAGRTPLDVATIEREEEIVLLLLGAGAVSRPLVRPAADAEGRGIPDPTWQW